jgi:hypothetical protein
MSDESLKAYLKTREWRRTSAGIGAFMGLLTGLFLWAINPFNLAYTTCWIIIGCLILIQGAAGFFLSNRSASRFEQVIFWLATILGIAGGGS